MNGREAVKAMLDGKQVCTSTHTGLAFLESDGVFVDSSSGRILSLWEVVRLDHWEIVEEPATDAELVNELFQLAYKCSDTNPNAAAAYARAADMLEKRSIK